MSQKLQQRFLLVACPKCHSAVGVSCMAGPDGWDLQYFAHKERLALMMAQMGCAPIKTGLSRPFSVDPRRGLWSKPCRAGLCSECSGFRGRNHGLRLLCQHPYHRKHPAPIPTPNFATPLHP